MKEKNVDNILMSKMIGLIDQPSFPLMSSITSNTSEKHEL